MSRGGRSTGPWNSAMLASLGLAMALAASAQQPTDTGQGNPPPGQENVAYDASQMASTADPPTQVVRLSYAQGNVSVEPASVNQFSPAEVNYPLTTGDRVWTDYDALAEMQAGQMAVRMGQATDLTVTAMTDTLAQFGLGQGSVHLRTYVLDPDATAELDTPNVAVTVLAAGDARVDVDPTGDFTTVTVFTGVVQVDGNGLQVSVGAGQAARFGGTNPVSSQWLIMPRGDALDAFSGQQDQAYQAGETAEQNYLNADTVGGAELQQYGSWLPEEDYGTVWFPTSVPASWQPYCFGRWTWVAPWGWTWIESEPWGFAPFHYGRWLLFNGRWGWIPGSPVVRPVYAPALVVFVQAGSGVSAWFPLGPNEPYAPWYHASVLYLNRVNASGLYNRNVNQVRTVYNTTNRNVYVEPLGPRRQFENRAVGTVAVPQDSFAAGKTVRTVQMHLPAQQLASAPMIAHPMVTPQRAMLTQGTPKALPPRVPRPTLTSHEDATIGNQQRMTELPKIQEPAPVERPGKGAVKGTQAQSNEVNQIEYRNTPGQKPEGNQAEANSQADNQATTYVNQPAATVNQPAPATTTQPNQPARASTAVSGAQPGQQANVTQPSATQPSGTNRNNAADGNAPQRRPIPPNYPGAITLSSQSSQQSGQAMSIKGGEQPPTPRGTEQLPQPGGPEPRVQMQYNEPKQLYNRAVPPPTRPSFDQQREAIQNTDPGRPLSPQQLDNLRENRPVGQPQMQEAAPHPAPAPGAPAPQRSGPPPQRSGPPQQEQQRH